jgi:hypothetical protein
MASRGCGNRCDNAPRRGSAVGGGMTMFFDVLGFGVYLQISHDMSPKNDSASEYSSNEKSDSTPDLYSIVTDRSSLSLTSQISDT